MPSCNRVHGTPAAQRGVRLGVWIVAIGKARQEKPHAPGPAVLEILRAPEPESRREKEPEVPLVAQDCGVYPEISAGKHRCTVRFMNARNAGARAQQAMNDIPFRIQFCTL